MFHAVPMLPDFRLSKLDKLGNWEICRTTKSKQQQSDGPPRNPVCGVVETQKGRNASSRERRCACLGVSDVYFVGGGVEDRNERGM